MIHENVNAAKSQLSHRLNSCNLGAFLNLNIMTQNRTFYDILVVYTETK